MFEKYENEVINLRREFHKIPETAYEEFKTTDKIIEYLKSIGITDIKRVEPTGVIATIYGKGNKTVGIRADIDALNVCEETSLPFSSLHPGKMHACGHDGHIAILLTLAKVFMDNISSLNGNIKLIFQPAEEGAGGAKVMLKNGCLSNPKVDYMLSAHLWPDIETGKIDVSYGTTFATDSHIEIDINGKGGHGSQPEKVKDVVYAGSQIVIALKNLSKEFKEKNINHVLSICSFDCVSSHNIYKDNAHIRGTLRALSENDEKTISSAVKETVNKILTENSIDGTCEVNYIYPPLVNDIQTTKIIRKAIEENFSDALIDFGSVYAAEDFAFYAKEVPSTHLKIGTKIKEENLQLHNSHYTINEDSLILGVKAFYCSVISLLKE